jgi:NAD(P)H-dependent FMN reductase
VRVAKLGVIVGSVREGRAGLPIAHWFVERARAHGGFDVSLIDLKEMRLPLVEEPNHPRLRQYQHDTTRAWSAVVTPLDAFVFVTAEYNHSTPPALVNALDHLHHEWSYKAAGLVSYGGISGGLRGAQMLKLTLLSLKMVPITEAVPIPFYAQMMDKESGTFKGSETLEKGVVAMLDELKRWDAALAALRPSR